MTQQVINVGTVPNDGSGDTLRDSMIKINDNFTDLYGNVAYASNLSNYQTTAGLSANVATLTANNTSHVGSVEAANVVSNAQLIANLANYQTTAGLAANVATLTSNNASYAYGKSEADLNVNSAVYATNSINSNTALNANNASYLDNVPASSYINTTGSYTITGVHTHNANLIVGTSAGVSANGGYGTSGQVLTTNGTTVYWATPASGSGAGVNTDFQYTWANIQFFSNQIFVSSNVNVGNTGNTSIIVGNSSFQVYNKVNLDSSINAQYGFEVTNNTTSFISDISYNGSNTIASYNFAESSDGSQYTGTLYLHGDPAAIGGYSEFEISTFDNPTRTNALLSSNSSQGYAEIVFGNNVVNNNITAVSNSLGSFISLSSSNSSIKVGNSTVNVIINSTSFSGTSNNATYLGGTLASGYQTTAGLAANVATLMANDSVYLGGVLGSSYVKNTDSRVLSGNLNFTGTNTYFSSNVGFAYNINATSFSAQSGTSNVTVTGLTISVGNTTINSTMTRTAFTGANTLLSAVVNTNAFYIGNTTANASLNSTALSIGGATVANSTGANNAYYLGGTAASGYQTTAGLSANVATLSSNNSSYLGGVAAASYQTTAGLSANVALLAANSATYLGSSSNFGNSSGIYDSAGHLRSTPINSQTSAYTLASTDNGKTISITTGGVTVNGALLSAGQMFGIFNNSGSNQTITSGTGVTMYLSGTATTGNRTLAQYGYATIIMVSSNTFVISGAGLT